MTHVLKRDPTPGLIIGILRHYHFTLGLVALLNGQFDLYFVTDLKK